jgi:hypothetical protein
MPQYAANTAVSTEASRGEIERTLTRYGADSFAYGWQGAKAMVQFAAHGRHIRFILEMPDKDDPDFWTTPARRRQRSPEGAYKEWEQASRQRWRALALVIKAKLEAVESGISEFEDEFLANIVLPNGSTAGEWMRPQIAKAYTNGKMPSMLPELTA